MTPKFEIGEVCYYVSPIGLYIDLVKLEFRDEEIEAGIVYWIDHSGAYLPEHDLVKTLPEAKVLAQLYLERFYLQKTTEIRHSNPTLNFEED